MKKILLPVLSLIMSLSTWAQTNGDWTPLGPTDFPSMINWQVNGVARISQIKFHPSDPNTIYAVNAMGGLFISRNKGANWTACGADKIPQTRCASVCIDNNNDQVIYYGTGDPSYYSEGLGIWKSTDGGNTFTQKNAGIGNRLVVEMLMPQGSSNILAATNHGIWKSTNGGDTWVEKKIDGGFTDMVCQPGNPNVIYASTWDEFWRSADQGETWTKISMPGSGILNGGRIGVTQKDPNIVYVTYVGDFGAGTCTPVLKSTNGGLSFSVVRTAGTLPNLNSFWGNGGGQGNYNYCIAVDPLDVNHVLIAGHNVYNSTDGGATFTGTTNWTRDIHSDMRQMAYSPYTPNEIYNINDGGIWKSSDNWNTWTPICNGLMGTESYNGIQSTVDKGTVSVGAQDNGEFVYSNGRWYTNGAGDYHTGIAFDNLSANYYYQFNGDNVTRRGLPNGPNYQLNVPFTNFGIYPHFPLANTQVAFFGTKTAIYRTADLSSTHPAWVTIANFNTDIRAMATSPTDANVLYIVTSDGKIRRSDNALAATPTFITYNTPGSVNATSSVVVMKNNTDVVYILCNNKVYRSTDKGATWTDYTGNLPNVNYNTLLHDVYSTNEAIYLAGWSTGILYRDNTLSNWVNYSNGLPSIAGLSKAYIYNDGTDNSVLTVVTGGRGVWRSGLYGKTQILREPENPENAIPKIVYEYYEGSWKYLPIYNSLTPIASGFADVPNISPRKRNDNYALKFDGYIDVPSDGKYTFYISSDDGSAFYIGDKQIIINDGIHGDIEKSGYIWLKKGKHKFTLTQFQGVGGQSLSFSWEGHGISKQLVPASVLYRLSPPSTCPENGSITVESWYNITGATVASIPVGNTPSKTELYTSLESKNGEGDNYGRRYRGYFCPPYTGNYVFYLACDDDGEIWLSTTGNTADKVKIISVDNNHYVDLRNFFKYPSQKSAKIYLKAGQKYYIEALHKEASGGDNFSLAMEMPTGEFQVPVQGAHLSPYKTNAFPTVTLSAPVNNSVVLSGTNIAITANAADTDGSVSKVEFYVDDIKVGEDNTSPYSFTWNTVPAGTYAVTTRVFDNAGAVAVSGVNTVKVLDLRTPENPAITKAKLDYKYYEFSGDRSTLPDFTPMTPVKTGVIPTFNISVRNRDDHYGIAYKGFIDVPADGLYTFYLASDDGARLYFGTQELINNDGIHGMSPEVTGVIGLKAGKHAISLNLFQNLGGQGLSLSYSGPGISKTEVPASALYRQIINNTKPVVSISAPANNAAFLAPATIGFTANASDVDIDGSISKVEFYNGSTLLGTSTSSPYTYNMTNVGTGTYNITAIAYDDLGDTAKASVKVNVGVAIVYQHCGYGGYGVALQEGNYNLSDLVALGVNNDDISSVKVKAGYQLTLFADINFTGNTLDLTSDSACIWAANFNDAATSLKLSTVNYAPTVSITAPINNATYIAPANISVSTTATDSDGSISKVELYINNVLSAQGTGSPFVYNWNNVAVGTYSIYAKAYDNKNAVATSSTITVKVNANQLPVVAITSPVNNAKFVDPANVSIAANASDADGSISKVEFYNGSVLLGEDLTAPYDFNWSGVGAGTYTITAKAYDNFNAIQTSSAVTIIIDPVITGVDMDTVHNYFTDRIKVYPNPVIGNATINFNLKESGHTEMVVLDLRGSVVGTVTDQVYNSGEHRLVYNFGTLSGGTYFIKMTINGKSFITKVLKVNAPKNGEIK